MAGFVIRVVNLDGSVEARGFDSEEDFASEYAELCGCGYDVHVDTPGNATARRGVA